MCRFDVFIFPCGQSKVKMTINDHFPFGSAHGKRSGKVAASLSVIHQNALSETGTMYT